MQQLTAAAQMPPSFPSSRAPSAAAAPWRQLLDKASHNLSVSWG
ncbi:hypothetical protein OROHE_008294 [Orobanche hederae]